MAYRLQLDRQKVLFELERNQRTQGWLARQLPVSRQRLSKILQDQPLSQVNRLAKILEVRPEFLTITVEVEE